MVVTAEVAPAPVRSSPEELSPARAARRAEIFEALTSLAIIPEDAYSLKGWNLGTFAAFKPRNSWDEWVTQQATVMMFRISRGERIERRLRDMQALRAFDCWETDQQLAAEVTASQTNVEPLRIYAQLTATLAGCDWIIRRWELLVPIAPENWTNEQMALSRVLHPGFERDVFEPGYPAARLAGVRELREQLHDSDRALRALAEADLALEPSVALKQVRRYFATQYRQLRWLITQLRTELPEHRLDYRYQPEMPTPRVEPYPPHVPVSVLASQPQPPPTNPDRTKPTDAAPVIEVDREFAETNPLSPDASAGEVTETAAEEPVSADHPTNPTSRRDPAKKRIDPARALAELRARERRRTA